MTRTNATTLAVAADYADAMMVARRAKNTLFLLLVLVLLIQLGIFFTVRFVHNISIRANVTTTQIDADSTHTRDVSVVDHSSTSTGGMSRLSAPLFEYLIAGTDFLGVVFSIALAIILLLIVTIMLVGRLIGVSHVTSAFCWSIVFIVILFPWQSLLNSRHSAMASSVLSLSASATTQPTLDARADEAPDIRIPGVLYTWPELRHDYDFPNSQMNVAVLKWARFVGIPIIALILLLMIQARSSRGLRFALGEAEMQVDVTTNSPNPNY